MDERQPILKRLWTHPTTIGIMVGAVLLVVALAIAIGMSSGNLSPIPSNVRKAVAFPLYYPATLPAGYSYKKDSARVNAKVVFYALENGNHTVTISEQEVPDNPPDLSRLGGFTDLQTNAGKAAIGSSLGQPMAIILTNTTLITITGQKDTPSDSITSLAKTMTSLPR